MAKIENVSEKTLAVPGYRVAVSFNGLDKGAVFPQEGAEEWAAPFLRAGYLEEVVVTFERREGRQG